MTATGALPPRGPGALGRLGALGVAVVAALVVALWTHPGGRHSRGLLAVVALVLVLGIAAGLVRVLLAARPAGADRSG